MALLTTPTTTDLDFSSSLYYSIGGVHQEKVYYSVDGGTHELAFDAF